jgi:hypothetical protein
MTEVRKMNRNRNALALIGVFAFMTLLMTGWSTPASADGTTTTTGSGSGNTPLTQQNNGTLWDIRNHWKLRNALGAAFLPTEAGGTDSIQNGQSTGPGTVIHGPGPVQMWPIQIPTATSQVPSQRDTGISKNLMTTFGWPLSDTQFQILGRMNDNIKLEEDSDPERAMWNSTAQGAMQSGSAANSAAGMTANQGQSAILFQEKFLVNFTSEAGNRWLVIRDQLFIPIAVLLLLPGAVLCQVKAIVAQGSNVLGEVNPFEGIFRSIIAIFMIPGTLLVINYGIDVSNSVHYTIADEYSRIFGTNMYYDAQCAMWRAFPVNSQNSNQNALRPSNPVTPPIQGNAIQSTYEALDLDVRQYDPCAGLDNSIVPDENQNQNMILARLMTNGTNVGLTGTWNVLCAFQEAFLFYLFCMGPIAAALWVWPVKSLRGALGSWCEGVMILCFWSLFWNTVVLLMACFRGVSETGTVIMTALNFLSTIVTQYAFDFVGLVTSGASAGVQQALAGAAQNAGGGGGSGGGSGSGGQSAGGSSTPRSSSATKPGTQSASTKHNPMTLAAASTSPKGPGGPASPAPKPKGATGTGIGTGAGTGTGTGTGTGSVSSSTTTPPATRGAFPISTSSAPTSGALPGGPAGPAKGDPNGGPPLTTGTPNGQNQTGAGGPNLHINGDGSMSVSGTNGKALSTEDKKHIAEQMSQVQKAMENHDAAALAKMAGPDANMKDINNLAQNGSLSTAAQVAMVNGGAGLSTTADGHLVSSTGVPGTSGVSGSQASIGVVGANGISDHGVNIGGPGDGPQVMSRDGFTGTAMGIQSGVDYAGANQSQINQLAKENNLNPNQMSMLTGPDGKGEIVGPNNQALGHIQDGNLYAPASNNNVVMEQNGQWAAASTGTPLTHEGGAGSNSYQVAGTQIGFDGNSGNFNVGGHSMTASEFAQNTPQGVYAHTPGQEAPAVQGGQMMGLSEAQQAGMQHLGQVDGVQNLQTSANGQQISGVGADGQQHVIANEVGGQWVSAQQAQGGMAGGEVMNSQGQWVQPGAEHNAQAVPLNQVSGMDSVHQQAFQQLGAQDGLQNLQMSGSGQQVFGTDASGHQQVLANEVGGQWVSAAQQHGGAAGGEVMNSQGQWTSQGLEYNAPSTPLSQVSGMDTAHQQAFQQLGAQDGLQNLQMSGSGQQIFGTDASGHQQVLANEVGGQWVSAQQQHGGVAGGEVMNNQGQFVSQNLEHNAPAVSSGSMAGLDAAQQQSFQQMANAEHLSNPSVSANGQQVIGMDSGGQQHVMANEIGGQWVSTAQAGVAGGEVMNNQGQWTAPGGEHQAQATPLSQVSGMDSVQQQAFQNLGNSEGYNNLQVSANGQQMLGTDSSGQQHVMATEVGGQWAAAQHNGGADVVMNNQGQWVAPGSSTPLAAHEGSGGTTWSPQGAPDVTYNPTTHTMESGSFSAPAANVTPDMVSNISGNAGLQTLGSEMGASNVHTSYDAQSGMMQAVGSGSDGSSQVVANYNSAEHRWEAAGTNGQVVENSSGSWVANNAGVNGLGSDVHVQANHQGGFDAVGQNGNVVASYDSQAQRWTADNGSVVQDNNHNWVANNQYVNTAQETPVQYNAGGTAYDQSTSTYSQTQSPDGGTWSAQAAPELTLNNGTFSTTYGEGGSAALSMNANNVTPDLVNYVHQNPQQIEGLQNLANHNQLPGSIELQQGSGGAVQAYADGQAFAQNNGSGWTSDVVQQAPQAAPDTAMAAMQQLIDSQSAAMNQQPATDSSAASSMPESSPPQYAERNDGSWVTQDSSHSVAHASDGHAMIAQPEPQIPSSPPTSSHNPSIAATGFGAGAAALGGAWGALKKQNSMNNPPPTPKAPAPHSGPAAPEATAQNKSLTPQESQARAESEKKRREALAKLLKDQGMPGGDT